MYVKEKQVQEYLWFQAFTRGAGTYSLWVKGGYYNHIFAWPDI